MKGKVFYSDHIPYVYRSEEKNYSLLWVNKNFVNTSVYSTLFKNQYGWMIKDGQLYNLKERYEDAVLGKYKYKQITEAAHDLFQGVNDVEETEKIIIVESKYVPDMMRSKAVHHYLPMFDGYAYSFDADGNLECWRIVTEVEIEEDEAPEPELPEFLIKKFHVDGEPFLARYSRMPLVDHLDSVAYMSNVVERYTAPNKPVRLDHVVYNDPATIACWSDGTKTIVKCGTKDTYDPEKGLLLCIAKKVSDNGKDWYKKLQSKLPLAATKSKKEVTDGEMHKVLSKFYLKREQRKVLKSILQEFERKHEIYGDGPMLTCYTAEEADTLTQVLKVIMENLHNKE